MATDLDLVTAASRALGDVPVRERRWAHLQLCVLDAVFSVGARYSATTRTVWAYARSCELSHVLEPAEAVAAGAYAAVEQPVMVLGEHISLYGAGGFADLVGNRQRTSPRGGVLKAQAAHDYAIALAKHGVLRLADVADVLASPDRLTRVEADLARIPGHGTAGVRMSYLWMVAGDDTHIKPDRMVLGWLLGVLGRRVSPVEAASLLTAAADALEVTPWQLDHAVWHYQRSRSSRPGTG